MQELLRGATDVMSLAQVQLSFYPVVHTLVSPYMHTCKNIPEEVFEC